VKPSVRAAIIAARSGGVVGATSSGIPRPCARNAGANSSISSSGTSGTIAPSAPAAAAATANRSAPYCEIGLT
jgi:hypothetical protein